MDEQRDKLIEAAVALLDAAPGKRLQITNLNKALFYLDLAALRDLGKTLTGCTYVAYERGPVVDRYQSALVDELVVGGFARQDDLGMSKPLVLERPIMSFQHMDDYHRQLAALVAAHIAEQTAKGVSDWSHKNPGWLAARSLGESVPIDMLLALQQVVNSDPWLSEPLNEEERAALDDSGEAAVPW